MPVKKSKQEDDKIDWHRFEYTEIGNESEDAESEGDPEQRVKNTSLKNLEMFLRKSWCCGK